MFCRCEGLGICLLPATPCIHTPRLFQVLKMQGEPSPYSVSQLCCLYLPLAQWVIISVSSSTTTWSHNHVTEEKAGGRKSRGNDLIDGFGNLGKIIPWGSAAVERPARRIRRKEWRCLQFKLRFLPSPNLIFVPILEGSCSG